MATNTQEWGIFKLNRRTLEHERFMPKVDGVPLVFRTKKQAIDWAYDNHHAGQRGQDTRFMIL